MLSCLSISHEVSRLDTNKNNYSPSMAIRTIAKWFWTGSSIFSTLQLRSHNLLMASGFRAVYLRFILVVSFCFVYNSMKMCTLQICQTFKQILGRKSVQRWPLHVAIFKSRLDIEFLQLETLKPTVWTYLSSEAAWINIQDFYDKYLLQYSVKDMALFQLFGTLYSLLVLSC